MIIKRTTHNYHHGATIIELLLVVTIIGVFTRLITFSLFRGQQQTSLRVSRDMLISDMRRQQARAMHGNIESLGVYTDYSIRFEENRYVLFPGVVYDPENSANEIIQLDAGLVFEPIQLPSSMIIFARLSGDVRDFDSDSCSVTIANTETGSTFTMRVNERGIPFIE